MCKLHMIYLHTQIKLAVCKTNMTQPFTAPFKAMPQSQVGAAAVDTIIQICWTGISAFVDMSTSILW